MTKENMLYEDKDLRIGYHPRSGEDHLLYIRDSSGEELNYIIQRGILAELARTPRGELERKIGTVNSQILFAIKQNKVSPDALHVAICQAYIREEEQVRAFSDSQNS